MWSAIIKAWLLIVVAVPAGQAVYGDVNELAAESLAVYKQVEKVNAQRDEATREQSRRIGEIESRLRELDPKIVEEYKNEIQQYTEQIEQLKKKIADLQRKIDAVEKADPERTKAEEARLQADSGELRARQRELAKPFDEQIEQLKRVAPEKKAAFNKAMEKYCLVPGKQYAEVTDTQANATFGGSIISYGWKDAKGRQLAWAHLRLRDKRVIPARAEMLDGTYYVSNRSGHSIWLWAGHFKIAFIMNKKEWQGKEKVAEAVKCFVDLKGLAKIDATKKLK